MASTILQTIKSLAVSYHAYCAAVETDDHNGIVVWAEMLLDDQQATGVEMLEEQHLRRSIRLHRDIADREKTAAVAA